MTGIQPLLFSITLFFEAAAAVIEERASSGGSMGTETRRVSPVRVLADMV